MTTDYTTDLTNAQYDTILQIMGDNRKRKHSLREIRNPILYLLKTGCHWRMFASDLPKVYLPLPVNIYTHKLCNKSIVLVSVKEKKKYFC